MDVAAGAAGDDAGWVDGGEVGVRVGRSPVELSCGWPAAVVAVGGWAVGGVVGVAVAALAGRVAVGVAVAGCVAAVVGVLVGAAPAALANPSRKRFLAPSSVIS